MRKALGKSDDGVEWIATVPRVGYRFAGPVRTDDDRHSGETSSTASEPSRGRSSIAVLPFRNVGNDPDQDPFCEGLSEDLITDLSKVPGLTVIARNSSFAYRGRDLDIGAIADELGVAHVVQGSVRRDRNRVRINAELSDADAAMGRSFRRRA